ncbi:MAG: DUF1036 domain-containing protein [Alphaproteobacteria bacterium]|nr:DUF1036 domain-containing protein [Alphaproteobacteria bacterium]
MPDRITIRLILALVAFCGLARPAHADLQICSRMSYVVEAAIAIEDKGAAATRGWFRINPGQCRTVIQGTPPGETLYLHARALPAYGGSPLPQAGHADFCVGADTFTLPATQGCNRTGQRTARFTAVKPTETDKGLVAYLAEDAEYTDEQARDAGIQRLLVIAGYDANPIDGVRGEKTDAALAQFIADNKLENTAAGRADFFDLLIAAAQKPNGAGFAWCNETRNTVMAALGLEEQGAVVTRGWYRVAPGKCLRPDLTGKPRRLYSFGEAVGADGQPLKDTGKPAASSVSQSVSWGGSTILCTRNVKFELSDHKDCGNNGLTATGFATVEMAGSSGTTVQFK